MIRDFASAVTGLLGITEDVLMFWLLHEMHKDADWLDWSDCFVADGSAAGLLNLREFFFSDDCDEDGRIPPTAGLFAF